MNTLSKKDFSQLDWQTIVMFVLGFWLSGSIILDLVIIPSLFTTGMMGEAGFASASYLMFGIFNRIELLSAGLVLTGFLVFYRNHNFNQKLQNFSVILASILLVITLVYTYFFTPQMSSLGLQLNLFESNSAMPAAMISMHEVYWILEVVKLAFCATLLHWSYRNWQGVN